MINYVRKEYFLILCFLTALSCSHPQVSFTNQKEMDSLVSKAKISVIEDMTIIEEIEKFLLKHENEKSVSSTIYTSNVGAFDEAEYRAYYYYDKEISKTFFTMAKKTLGHSHILFGYNKDKKNEGKIVGEYSIFACRVKSTICNNIYQENLKDKRVNTQFISLENDWVIVAYYYDFY